MATRSADAMHPRTAPVPGPLPLPFPSLLQITIWFAIVAGLIETSILAVQRHLMHHLLYRSAQYVWMPSVGAMIVFVTVILLVRLAALIVTRLSRQDAAIAFLSGLAAFSVLMVTRWLHPLAALILAIGFAASVARRPTATQTIARIARRSFPGLVILLGGLVAYGVLRPVLLERRALAAAPAARSNAPNILFLILDTVRGRSLSLYGYERETTPNLKGLARRGVVFDRAIATAPWTLPSHGSMFTGRPAQDLNAGRFTPLNDAYPTIAEVLAAHGYATGGFAANLAYVSYEFGLQRGFQHWNDYPISLTQILTNSSLGRFLLLEGYSGGRNSWPMRVLGIEHWIGHTRTAADINAKLVAWVSAQHKPFFAFANYFDTHMPYVPPEPYLGEFGPVRHRSFLQRLRTERPGKWPHRGNPANEQRLRDRYEESIAYLDSQIGALLAELQSRGALENTIVVVASDHGEEFGEAGAYEHDSGLSFNQIRVPLLVVGPRIPRSVRIERPVSLRDLAVTLAELSGNEASGLAGASLAPLWSGSTTAHTSPVYSALEKKKKSQASIVDERFQYIKRADGEQLYDHLADPNETHDLVGTPVAAAVLDRLRALLDAQDASKVFRSSKR